ncbi:hypothetical protein [Streptomyces sp. NBC_00893]|uniref:hypothetical protein n=1 Tax=Streptomyces sp. NBC_00893 TaxID=2975862 RepID=UPI0022500562|nr:hypothetical protein [Streptomyces sp. NBC_00893]MCX4844523.1 hypothetical protein [Streptomyces sp. NBC_00893]
MRGETSVVDDSPPLARKALLPGEFGRDASRFTSVRAKINSTLFGDEDDLV